MSRYREEQEDLLYNQAKKNIKRKKGFYAHFSVFLSVGIFFFTINMLTDPFDIWWPLPMVSWGVGLAIHYFAIFGLPFTGGILTKDWEEKEIEKEMNKLKYKYDVSDEEPDFPQEKLDLPVIEKQKNYKDTDFV